MKNVGQDFITLEKGTKHNLKNVSLKIPHHQITCFTGVSGSGKSSLVYDIICKESQRRYFESFSSYARQFLGKMSRPEVEHIEGLMPSISVDQKTVSRNPRSTVGIISELYDYLRLLFARTGQKPNPSTELKLTRSLFSFNSPEGYCSYCKGLGVEDQIDPKLLIKDANKSLREGALKITTPSGYTIYSQVTIDVMDQVCQSEGFNVDIKWKDLTDEQKYIILYGSNKIKIPFGKHTLESRMKWSGITAKPREEGFYKGILPIMENILRIDRNPNILRFAKTVKCTNCDGTRLNKESLSITIKGKNIIDLAELSISKLKEVFQDFSFDNNQRSVAEPIIEKIIERCLILENLGLGYLSLMRESTTLSGGEAQRIRLATQLGNGLRGILYILDEPSIGLHPRDNNRMINVMKELRNQGNTVLVVEHDKETMLNADRIIDIGPYAGKNGGKILFNKDILNIKNFINKDSETLKYLFEDNTNSELKNYQKNKWLKIKGASLYNLKNIDVQFRLHSLNVVTGVSGAGKSTLVFDILGKFYQAKLNGNLNQEINCSEILSDTEIQKIIEINQTPIGRTPRSNPATYTKLFDQIRMLFANLHDSKKNNWNQGHFSFNTKGGRCEICEGAGYIQTGMHFLANVETVCETCEGKRYDDETLTVKYLDKNISEILEMEISDACDFFSNEPKIHHYLEVLKNLGLGYLSLGQSSTTLSGGEAQRLKLSAELVKATKNHTLYIFDEPTTGLHPYDVSILLEALKNLTKKKHTVVVIEHDFGIIKNADHIIDLGPEGGNNGGEIIFSGSYNELLDCKNSHTSKALSGKKTIEKSKEKIDLQKVIDAPISLKGVKTHNLKNIDVDIPRNKLTVITGVSGSGKSSLAFDTLFAEGQFRYTESFSTYARSLIQQKSRPNILESKGLTPTIAINNKSVAKSPRATGGTITGLYDLYRLLYSRISKDKSGNPSTVLSSHFSFNHQAGACSKCNGLGFKLTCDPNKLITNPNLTLVDGAMKGSKIGEFYGDPYGQYISTIQEVGKIQNINFNVPWNDLNEKAKKIVLFGTGEIEYEIDWKYKRKNREGSHQFQGQWLGFANYIDDEYQRKHDKQGGDDVAGLMKEVKCNHCSGTRLNQKTLQYKIANKNIAELSKLEAVETIEYFKNLNKQLSENDFEIASSIIKSCIKKLNAMIKIGLGYLSISRSTMTLSGGEGRRLRLVSQLGGELVGITYVLDEPTVGLHAKDTQHLIELIKQLSERNTVVVVEHDEDVIKAADYILELGQGAGDEGGEIIAKGEINEFFKNKESLTSKYLQKDYNFNFPKNKLELNFGIEIKSASANNLKNIDVKLPINGITVFSGVSGSGKSSLLFDVIAQSAVAGKSINCKSIKGLEYFSSIIKMDQSSIGKNPLSTPVTFLNLYDQIRNLFADTEIAIKNKFRKSYFSYNTKGGRCETCKGQGQIKISMDFLSDVWVTCSDCDGKRFKNETLRVKWNNYSISEILELNINKAFEVFKSEVKLKFAIELLCDLGLGHLKLGQSATTLSGGEAQRLKLAKELLKKSKEACLPARQECLYLLDEPTTGLHFYDIEKLLQVLFKLRDQGHALYIIEHHPWFMKIADCLIELGPEGGENGGYLLSK
ncbi:MAG: excinuclease ABC subunit UvrA [Bacteroidales bacterium]|jgi:excinuclease ABC subunit A|nr:excinuclease ABC subunit UvrA [Bacteroidales bacterium]